MERGEPGDSERGSEGDPRQTTESDNPWPFKSVPEEELHKWKTEKDRYDEVIEYIREVDEILDLIRPFSKCGTEDKPPEAPVRPRHGLDHLENIIKLVQQLKELQENSSKLGERTWCARDLKKLREHKRRLKSEELELRTRTRARSTPDEFGEACPRKGSSTSEKLEEEHREGWQNKRKSLSLESKSKVSKWTKVKEAFHWEKAAGLKDGRKEDPGPLGGSRDQSPESLALDDLDSPPPPPPPPPVPTRPEDFLSPGTVQDFPSSSSSDRLDEFLGFSQSVAKESKASEAGEEPEGPDNLRRKSSCDEVMFKDDRSGKTNKTTWGKVKDIIQTRKDSLKKKPKKRGSDEFKKRRKLSSLSSPQFSDQFEDLSSPEEKAKNTDIPKIAYDFAEEVTPEEKCTKRLTPALTVTLPSTEELRSFPFDDPEKKETVAEDEKTNVLEQFSCQAHYCEDKSKFGKGKSGQNQRLSRWIKVKRVFLTSASPPRVPQYLPVSNSSPTSQNKSSGFFSDLESDELSSGEWIDDKSPSQERQRPGYPELQSASMIQEDIRKSYNELQKKLSQEFDQKLREWEMKSETPPKPEEASPRAADADAIPRFRKTRDSIAVPLPNLNDLSPEFKKKLNDWKKMKTSQSSSSVSSSATKEEIQGQNIKIRIGEWQPWKTRCSPKTPEDYPKRPEEKAGGSRPPANRRKEDEGGSACSTARRGSKRRDSVKKISQSRSSSGGESLLSTSSTDKDGRFIRRSQKVKDFQWVEKELQKIEREKLRLEQEKEKYLEREARLEKMKKTMGTTCPTQEVLVRTPEGFFRFKGISQKFTKKLYEWEKARGIAPEASTFALLEESAQTKAAGDPEAEGVALQRSKSTGSVPELSSALLVQTMAHHPSSLSLNDVDDLKTREEDLLDESISSEQIKEEPEAIIVDVEDIIEETALPADGLGFKSEQPVYTYAPEGGEAEGLYFSGDFNVRIVEEREGRRDFGTRADPDPGYREPRAKPETQISAKCGISEMFNKGLEDDSLSTTEDSETLKGAQEAKNASPEELPSTKAKEKRRKNTEADEKLGQKSAFFSEADSPRHLYPEGRSDPEVLKRKIKEKITLMQRMSTEASWKHVDHDAGRSESVSVFVPTTRKIISPVKTTQGATPSVCSYVIDDVKPEENGSKSASPVLQPKMEASPKRDIGMPPLPANSPKFVRKLNPKETAPSIRMIIAKYNQKISEHDGAAEKRPESGSPIWRSPVFGRRTQEKIDRFARKEDEGRRNGEVQKSASLDNVRSKKSLTPPQEIKGILKSSSAGVVKTRVQNADLPSEASPSVLRALKIQKAKEEFLSGRLSTESEASAAEAPSTSARLTQAEPEPEQSLTKSVSAETLPGEGSSGEKMADRPLQKSSSKFDISSIKSKFRKIRMRKEKEPKANAVAVLCRQSLFIEVPKTGAETQSLALSKSCPSSPVMDRNKPPPKK